jgi:hypothetical protein
MHTFIFKDVLQDYTVGLAVARAWLKKHAIKNY